MLTKEQKKCLVDLDVGGQIHDRFTIDGTNLTQVGIWWLMSAYIYYCREDLESVLEDSQFDHLTKILMDNFDEVQKLTYRTIPDLITMERLRAGTAFDLREHDYPTITRSAAVGATMDTYWILEEVFLFQFPEVARLEKPLEIEDGHVHPRVGKKRIVDYIIRSEPSLQDKDKFKDTDDNHNGAFLQDRYAEDFYDGVIATVMEKKKPNHVIGSFYFDEDVGWTVKVFDPTRYLRITTNKEQ